MGRRMPPPCGFAVHGMGRDWGLCTKLQLFRNGDGMDEWMNDDEMK